MQKCCVSSRGRLVPTTGASGLRHGVNLPEPSVRASWTVPGRRAAGRARHPPHHLYYTSDPCSRYRVKDERAGACRWCGTDTVRGSARLSLSVCPRLSPAAVVFVLSRVAAPAARDEVTSTARRAHRIYLKFILWRGVATDYMVHFERVPTDCVRRAETPGECD